MGTTGPGLVELGTPYIKVPCADGGYFHARRDFVEEAFNRMRGGNELDAVGMLAYELFHMKVQGKG